MASAVLPDHKDQPGPLSDGLNSYAFGFGGADLHQCAAGKGELTFQNLRYIVTVCVTPADVLVVEAEQKSDGARWRASFSARHIEDMTQRIGSYKKFSVFVKMLYSAILQDSDSVFVDLLTNHDLEDLKCRKARNLDRVKRVTAGTALNKRYLILTYVGEFDRIHYPLALAHEENLEPDILRRTIKRLRIEAESLKKQLHVFQNQGICQDKEENAADIDQDEHQRLRKENCRLLTQVRCLEDSMIQLLGYKGDSNASGNDKQKLANELARYQKKCSILLSKLEAKMISQKDVKDLEDQVNHLQNLLKIEKEKKEKLVANLTREKQALVDKVRQSRESERSMRLQFRTMERELDHLKRRLKLQGASNMENPYSKIRVNSRPPSQRTTPLSSRENSPCRRRFTKTMGSRSSSCPTFRSQNSCDSNPREEVKLPIYKEYLKRKPPSLTSPTRLRDCSGYKSSSTKSRDYCALGPSKLSSLSRNSEDTDGLSTSRSLLSSVRNTWREDSKERHPKCNLNVEERVYDSCISSSFCGGEDEVNPYDSVSRANSPSRLLQQKNQHDSVSRTNSPKRVLQQVKAKLVEYARMQEMNLEL